METQKPIKIAPSGRELSPQVPEGASGRCSCGLIMERYLLVVVDTQSCTAVTIPGTKSSLAKGSWHGAAVTEGFTVGTFPKYKLM